jgi:2-hydroxychromene-2-carboxylate isomerase
VIAAGAQNKAFEYAKVLYDNQGTEESGWLDGTMMARIAASVTGLDLEQWRKDTNSAEAKSVASAVDKLATTSKVIGTPTVLVGCMGKHLQDVTTPGAAPNLQETTQALDALACTK